MKKIILTIVALLVSAVMVFAFAGCGGKEPEQPETEVGSLVEEGDNTLVDEQPETGTDDVTV